ncbi:hypothetical protein LMG24235_08641 [Paraburkholderia sabiae]|nr:hypothetical protein LMG24235_08641 [Paraburkholderia sabiae]
MDGDAIDRDAARTGSRRPRQGEAFWREMVVTWKASGVGTRRFCREQGHAVSTFRLWRKKFAGETPSTTSPLAVTADAPGVRIDVMLFDS